MGVHGHAHGHPGRDRRGRQHRQHRHRRLERDRPDTDDASVPVAQTPALNIVKDATVPGGTADVAGEVISYTITVAEHRQPDADRRDGDRPVRAEPDPRSRTDPGDNDNLLEVGETWAYTATHTVTQAEIDAGHEHRQHRHGRLQRDRSGHRRRLGAGAQTPALNIVKDATVPGGTADMAGELISYTITVQNTGNQTLTGVTVTDPFVSNLTRIADRPGDNDNLLEVGETWGFTATHTVTQAEIDAAATNIVNTATADSNETGPTPTTLGAGDAEAGANIVKDATVPGGTADVAGELISYTITVQNTGNQTLTGVTVVDPFVSQPDPRSRTRR